MEINEEQSKNVAEEMDLISYEQFLKMKRVLETWDTALEDEKLHSRDASRMNAYISKASKDQSNMQGLEYEEKAKLIMEGNGFSAAVLEHPLRSRDPANRSVIFFGPMAPSGITPPMVPLGLAQPMSQVSSMEQTGAKVMEGLAPQASSGSSELQQNVFAGQQASFMFWWQAETSVLSTSRSLLQCANMITCVEIKTFFDKSKGNSDQKDNIPFADFPVKSQLPDEGIEIPLFKENPPDKGTFMEILSWYRKYVIKHPGTRRYMGVYPYPLIVYKSLIALYISSKLTSFPDYPYAGLSDIPFLINALKLLGATKGIGSYSYLIDEAHVNSYADCRALCSMLLPTGNSEILKKCALITRNDITALRNLLLTIGKSFLGFNCFKLISGKPPKQATIIETNNPRFMMSFWDEIFNDGLNYLRYTKRGDWIPKEKEFQRPYNRRIRINENKVCGYKTARNYSLEDNLGVELLSEASIPSLMREQYEGKIANILALVDANDIKNSEFIAKLVTGKIVAFHESGSSGSYPLNFNFRSSQQYIFITKDSRAVVEKLGFKSSDYDLIKVPADASELSGFDFFDDENAFSLTMLALFYTIDKLWLDRDDSVPAGFTEKMVDETPSGKEALHVFLSEYCRDYTGDVEKELRTLTSADLKKLRPSGTSKEKSAKLAELKISELPATTRTDLYFLFSLWCKKMSWDNPFTGVNEFTTELLSKLRAASVGPEYPNVFYTRKSMKNNWTLANIELLNQLSWVEDDKESIEESQQRFLYGVEIQKGKAETLLADAKKLLSEATQEEERKREEFMLRMNCLIANVKKDMETLFPPQSN